MYTYTHIIMKTPIHGGKLYFGACSGPSQAQDKGPSSIVLPESGDRRNIESGSSESNEDSFNRPEDATTPHEPDTVCVLDVFMLPLAFQFVSG